MKWRQELLWVKRNEQGVALRVEEERPPGVPVDQFYEDEDEDLPLLRRKLRYLHR
ncbi:hypothetical protein [Paenibacillus sp. Soil750]|uniref:hypothetical protein n=1 Tax=Paenibacillus sp. Soil750 TaxID=1736398 RepID=UPI000AF7E9E4|nr:hypothetical protein [Paenibacillus sp. Soil750]